MISIKYTLLIILTSAVFVFDFAQVDSSNSISVEQLKEEMEKNESLVILDVRRPFELNESLGYIEESINIPLQDLKSRMNELSEFKEDTIMVICKVGMRSMMATKILLENGFIALNITGGMIEFRKSEGDNE